jgi:hypothetical protein
MTSMMTTTVTNARGVTTAGSITTAAALAETLTTVMPARRIVMRGRTAVAAALTLTLLLVTTARTPPRAALAGTAATATAVDQMQARNPREAVTQAVTPARRTHHMEGEGAEVVAERHRVRSA